LIVASGKGIMMKRVLVDMSCTLIHHGHIRILKNASRLGKVIVALTTDDEIFKTKGYYPELKYEERREILLSISYVSEVIPCAWLIDDHYIKQNKIDLLVHGDDNVNPVTICKVCIFPRTEGISSTELRQRSVSIYRSLI